MKEFYTDIVTAYLAYWNVTTFLMCLIKSIFVIAIFFLTAFFFRKKSAKVRNWIWRFAVVLLIAIPLWGYVSFFTVHATLAWKIDSKSLNWDKFKQKTEALHLYKTKEQMEENLRIEKEKFKQEQHPPWENFFDVKAGTAFNDHSPEWLLLERSLVPIWFIPSAILLLIYFVQLMVASYWLKKGAIRGDERLCLIAGQAGAKLNKGRTPEIFIRRGLESPLLFGLWKPRIYMPEEVEKWEDGRIVGIILHEMAHVHRSDLWWQHLGKLACFLWWWNPLVYFACHRMRSEAEYAADDEVVLSHVSATEYAETLLGIASSTIGKRKLLYGIPMLGQNAVESRIRSLLEVNPWRGKFGASIAVLAGLVFILCGSVAVFRPAVKRPVVREQEKDSTIRPSDWQKEQLKKIYNAITKRATAHRYLHYKIERTDTIKDKERIFPDKKVLRRVEIWEDRWSGKFRNEIKEQTYYVAPTIYKEDREWKEHVYVGDENFAGEFYEVVREENQLARMSKILLQYSVFGNRRTVVMDLSEVDWKGRKAIQFKISSYFGNEEVPDSVNVRILDPENDYALLYFGWLNSQQPDKSPTWQWELLELGRASDGEVYPLKYRKTVNNDGYESIEEVLVTYFEVLPKVSDQLFSRPLKN